jgi:hypothetical protein
MRQAILLKAERVKPGGTSGWYTQSAEAIVANLSDISIEYPVDDNGMRSER